MDLCLAQQVRIPFEVAMIELVDVRRGIGGPFGLDVRRDRPPDVGLPKERYACACGRVVIVDREVAERRAAVAIDQQPFVYLPIDLDIGLVVADTEFRDQSFLGTVGCCGRVIDVLRPRD